MKTAEEYYQSRNGGKPSEDSTRDFEFITPTWAVLLMDAYASEVTADLQKRLDLQIKINDRLLLELRDAQEQIADLTNQLKEK